MKIGMTRGSKRILDLGRAADENLDETLIAGADEAIDGSSEEEITEMIHSMPLGEATLQVFLEADMDKVPIAATYLTPVLAIDARSMSIHAVPETKRIQHQAMALTGFPAREVVDTELLEGVEVIRVVDAGEGITMYLLDHEWNLPLTEEESDLCW